MPVEDVKEAIKNNRIDEVLVLAKYTTFEEVDEIVKLYEEYYNKELTISKTIQNILADVRIRRMKSVIPPTGCYTYRLE